MTDRPPWLPPLDLSKCGMILAILRCVHRLHYRRELHATKGEMYTFDNMCSGDLVRTASLLNGLKLTEYIDPIGRRSVFIVPPERFQEVVEANIDRVSMEAVEEVVVRLGDGGFAATEEMHELAEALKDKPEHSACR